MNEKEQLHLVTYRAALIALCKAQGGEMLVKCDSAYHEGGTLMYKLEPSGIRLRFVPDKFAQ